MVKEKNKVPDEDFMKTLKAFFYENYKPCTDPLEPGVSMMSTSEIYFSFFRLYPCRGFQADTIAKWLHEGKFKLIDIGGNMRFEWLIKSNI